MPKRARLLQLVPLALVPLAVLALGGSAAARPRYVRPAPAPDGRYGKLEGHQLIGFEV